MAEYIEREKLIKELNDIALDLLKDNSIQCSLAAGTVVDIKDNVVAEQPTADVVEVVRCKDCKYNRFGECNHDNNVIVGYEYNDYLNVDNAHFCGYGERKESEVQGE